MTDLERYETEAYEAASELIARAKPRAGEIFVVGCSTSEILGSNPGTNSAPDVGRAAMAGVRRACIEHSLYIAAECCEHLNRAVVLERGAAEKAGCEEVNVVPQPKAGGSFATALWAALREPCAVEHIRAALGMDIGGVLIGMQLREVAVPVPLTHNTIGEARIIAARTRPKYIGGERAVYDEEKK